MSIVNDFPIEGSPRQASRRVSSRPVLFLFTFRSQLSLILAVQTERTPLAQLICDKRKKHTSPLWRSLPRKIYRRGNGSEKRIGARDILFTFFVAGALRNDLFNLACALSGQLSVNNTGISPGN